MIRPDGWIRQAETILAIVAGAVILIAYLISRLLTT